MGRTATGAGVASRCAPLDGSDGIAWMARPALVDRLWRRRAFGGRSGHSSGGNGPDRRAAALTSTSGKAARGVCCACAVPVAAKIELARNVSLSVLLPIFIYCPPSMADSAAKLLTIRQFFNQQQEHEGGGAIIFVAIDVLFRRRAACSGRYNAISVGLANGPVPILCQWA
jgi:hypothetical protein